MFNYTIKNNGYPIGQAKGKKEAIERLKHYMAWEGIMPDMQKWRNIKGEIRVSIDGDIYSIEKMS